jgi:hypothetical protein
LAEALHLMYLDRRLSQMNAPTVDEVDRISSLSDPVVRNLQITQCYYQISRSIAPITAISANWCTFATWASKQAGQTIRQEDLVRAFEDRFHLSAEISRILEDLVGCFRAVGMRLEARKARQAILQALNPTAPFARAGDAVARGNKKVFEEIGREFARFCATFHDDSAFDANKTAHFCTELRAGQPPDGQQLLREAFTAYAQARFESAAKARTEVMLLANLLVGFHEQVRLQPEITEALNAPLENPERLKRNCLAVLLPDIWLRARPRPTKLLGRGLPLDRALDRLVCEVNRLVGEVITEHLMTLHLPGGEVLRLGRDLTTTFPPVLQQITHPKLREFLARTDATPNDLGESGAADWADFNERMHFITDFFRAYQEQPRLFEAPFTPEQVAALTSGKLPHGRL